MVNLELAYARARASRKKWAAIHRYWLAEADGERDIAEQDVRTAEAELAKLPPLVTIGRLENHGSTG